MFSLCSVYVQCEGFAKVIIRQVLSGNAIAHKHVHAIVREPII